MLSNRKSRRAGRARPSRAGFGASVEVFEKRELLTGIGSFIQGTAFVDTSATGTLTSADAPLSGVTISLYQGTTVSPATYLESTVTDSNGNYLFFNDGFGGSDGPAAPVAGQTYTVVETTPANYTSTAAQAFSQVAPAKAVAPNEIQVTAVSAAELATFNSIVTYSSLNLNSSGVDSLYYSVNGVSETPNSANFATQLNFSVTGDSNDLTSSFDTDCVDPTDDLVGPSYHVDTDPTVDLTVNGGEIGYLFDQYGGAALPSTLPSKVQGLPTPDVEAGLQVALWELEYPSTGASSGFVLNGYNPARANATDYADIQTAAAAFIADASGKSEQVGVLDASLTGDLPSPAATGSGGQSVLFGSSLNFGNAPVAATGVISGTDLLVSNTNKSAAGLSGSTPSVAIAGTTVNLLNASGSLIETTTTASDGSYSFSGLPLNATYSVVEVAPGSDNHLGQTSNTSGAVVATGSTVSQITLTPSATSSVDNFFETATVSVNGSDYLVPSNTSLTTATNGTAIAGTVISLTGTDEFGNAVSQTQTTSGNGGYSFAGLNPSNGAGYTVTETYPSAYAHLGQTSSTGATSTTLSTSASLSQIVLVPTGSSSTENFFEYGSSISGYVYADNNGNDTFDASDAGIAGVTVNLYNGAGTTVIASTTSGSNGYYSFGNLNLPAGQYNLLEYTPGGYTGETPNAGLSGGAPSNIASLSLEFITTIPVGAGVADVNNNFGQYKPGSLSGVVFVDATNSGSYVGSDSTLSGITLTLETPSGTPITTTTTGSGGTYSFGNLTPGSYKVVEGAVTGYGPDVTNTGSLTVAVTSGANTPNNNFGEVGLSSISGTVYVDATGQGLNSSNLPAGAGDTGEAGVTVTVTEANGTKLTTTTASNGTYSFTGLPYGTYGISESIPSGTYQTGPNSVTYTVTTTAASPSSTGDNFSNYMACNMSGLAAYYFTITTPSGASTNVTNLGGNVAQGDTVTAYFSIAPGSAPTMLSLVAYEAPTSSFSTSNAYLQVITSVATGTYGPGNYSETVTIPNSYFQVDFVCGAALPNLELNNHLVDYQYENRLISAANGGTQAYALSSLSGTVYADNNGNDTLDGGDAGLGGVQVFLYNADGSQRLATTTTASNGSYTFSNVTPGIYQLAEFTPSGYTAENPDAGSIGGNVSFSASSTLEVISAINLNSNTNATSYNFGGLPPVASLSGTVYADNNANDTLDSGDTGLGGVQVFLYNAAGTQRLATTTTASNGSYTFSNVTPGTYQVAEFVPGGYTVENPNAGTSGGSVSSSTSSGLEVIGAINLNAGTNATGYNFGGLPPVASISGTVYADNNRNDTLDSGDTGLGGVQVFLYNAAGTQRLATTTTNSSGGYTFSNVTPGTYQVAEFVPGGYTVENPNAGTSGGSVSSSTSSGLAVIGAINLGSGVSDTGNNFGALPPLATASSLSGIVYADINYNDVYNSGIDYGIAGVTVTLSGKTSYGASYTLTTTTDCYGNYSFTNIVTGNYTITETEPAGYSPEASNVGNAGGVIGLGSTSSVSVTAGAVDTGYNFGSKVNSCSLGNYQTCSTSYWCGSNGQSLIKCMNGGSSSTKLGNWLSSMLPNICKSYAGQTNAQVCSSFQWLNATNSCNAQIVSTALAAYCTNTSLAGCTTAANYGFSLSNCGAGNCTVNLGNTFASYGGPCGTTSLFQFLSFADSQSSSWGGWGGSSQSSVSSWFSSINGCSKIG